MSVHPDGSDPIGTVVESGYVDGMVTGWLVFGTFVDAETGEHHFFSDCMEGQSGTQTLGQLHHALVIEEDRTRRNAREQE